MSVIKVVCGLIWKGDALLICRRKPGRSWGGFWEFPGGKIEMEETPVTALKRELIEELGMQVSDICYQGQILYHEESLSIELIGCRCKFLSATFELADHDDWKFVPFRDLHNYKLASADVMLLEKLF